MAVSVRMEPLLEREMELAAKRRGITKSQFIVEAVREALGHKDAHQLLLQVREKYPHASGPSASRAKAKASLATSLREQHERESADWQAWQTARRGAKRRAA